MTHYSSLRLYWQEHCCGLTFQGFPQASLFLRAAFCPEGCSHTLSPPPSLPQDDRASSEIILSLSSDTLMTITGYCGTPVCRQLGPACVRVCVRTVSSSLHLLQRRLPQSLVGQLQLVSEPAQVPLRFGLDDTQLCVDVLVLICCILFVLKTHTMFGS